MKRKKLVTYLSFIFSGIVLAVIAAISLAANILISKQFERYVENQQNEFARDFSKSMAGAYNRNTDTWNVDYVHGMGMYALSDGYIIAVYDKNGQNVWDAQNHDMEACHQIMMDVENMMNQYHSEEDGEFIAKSYEIQQANQNIGKVEIIFFSPYYLNENAFHFLDSLNVILCAIGVTALVCAVLAAIFAARRVYRPLEQVIMATGAISAGNYRIRLESNMKTEELNTLMQSINKMGEALENQENIRKQMTTDVAHELKTPLAIVASHIEAMTEGVWEPTVERLQSCYEEIDRITRLVNDLQRLSQTESETLGLNKKSFDLKELSEEIVNIFEIQLLKNQLNCQVIGAPVTIFADKEKIGQVISNLISNAIKYSEPEGHITVRVFSKEQKAYLSVEDEGIGISPEDQDKIFERFYRTDKSRSRKSGGSGIGLTIVKTVIEAHGGSVSVESRERTGSKFTIQFPVSDNSLI